MDEYLAYRALNGKVARFFIKGNFFIKFLSGLLPGF